MERCPHCDQPLPWTQTRIIEAIREWHADWSRLPTRKEWQSGGEFWPSEWAVLRQFPNWPAAMRAAGFEPRPSGQNPTTWTREAVLEAITDWASHTGEPPSCSQWKSGASIGVPPVSTVQRLFGSWNAGMAAAGFQGRDRGGQALARAPFEGYRARPWPKQGKRAFVPRKRPAPR